ncbi:MAG: hypothetical protein ACRCVW_06480 [Brevinema sp.]
MIKTKLTFVCVFLFVHGLIFSQNNSTATYFENGINSPWSVGLDYDIGFAKVMSMNIGFVGGFNSQVNRVASFGDIYFGEFQIGIRVYMNKIDRWNGLFLNIVGRAGIYNIPFRSGGSQLIINRQDIFQYGLGIYLGYRWTRNLLKDMSGFPFHIILEPYLGWSLDGFAHEKGGIYNKFTVGLSFKLGFYTYKKSKATLEAEKKAKEELENETNTTTNNSINDK